MASSSTPWGRALEAAETAYDLMMDIYSPTDARRTVLARALLRFAAAEERIDAENAMRHCAPGWRNTADMLERRAAERERAAEEGGDG